MDIKKASGKFEPFQEEKLYTSATRAGIPQDLQEGLVQKVKKQLTPTTSTKDIARTVTSFLLEKNSAFLASKYNLKRGIMELGPTGYPFEDYFAGILQQEGYKTTTRALIVGKCITHEVDVIAQKGQEKLLIEAKFHNTSGAKTDIQVALYTKARFDDVKQKEQFTNAWIVTNTKITHDVMAYAACIGMHVLSWSYPAQGSLRELVEKYQLYPITCLSFLSPSQKETMLTNGIVFCKDICQNPKLIETLPFPKETKQQILSESTTLCARETYLETKKT